MVSFLLCELTISASGLGIQPSEIHSRWRLRFLSCRDTGEVFHLKSVLYSQTCHLFVIPWLKLSRKFGAGALCKEAFRRFQLGRNGRWKNSGVRERFSFKCCEGKGRMQEVLVLSSATVRLHSLRCCLQLHGAAMATGSEERVAMETSQVEGEVVGCGVGTSIWTRLTAVPQTPIRQPGRNSTKEGNRGTASGYEGW